MSLLEPTTYRYLIQKQQFRRRRQTNILEDLYKRDIEGSYITDFKSKHVFSQRLVKQLNLEAELHGHDGCVNCLEWNQAGNLLASGSDDLNIMIWKPFSSSSNQNSEEGKSMHPSEVIATKHRGNIFGVKFLPHTHDTLIASCAADRNIFVYDINHSSRPFQNNHQPQGDLPPPLHSIQSHIGRVKRLETSQSEPFLLWSCGEDGLVLEHDIRLPKADCSRILLAYDSATARVANSTAEKNTIIGRTVTGKSKEYRLSSLEAKCLAVNQVRSEYLAVGCNDPYARIYDRRRLSFRRIPERGINNFLSPVEECLFEYSSSLENDNIPVNFFVPGHLPLKIDEYRKRMKTLSITFLTFSPSGDQLLVNLGGEQLYLYDFIPHQSDDDSSVRSFKFDSYRELFKSSPTSNVDDKDKNNEKTTTTTKKSSDLPPKAEELKVKANGCFEAKHYVEAIEYYNKAIDIAPYSPILYGNRAAALMKRLWEGDVYAAMRDCYQALSLDPGHMKSHFRLCKCLNELGWCSEASECLKIFTGKFPDYASTPACESLVKEVKDSLRKTSAKSSSTAASASSSSSSGKQNSSKRFKHTNQDDDRRRDESSDEKSSSENSSSETDEEEEDEDEDEDEKAVKNALKMLSSNTKRSKRLIDRYQQARSKACDFTKRYCGHCNVATDIKEANFLGEDYIAAGSDDGCMFIWEKSSTNIARVLKGDDSIVNCVQPHPNSCYVATSGIDPHVRLWAPKLPDVDILYRSKKSSTTTQTLPEHSPHQNEDDQDTETDSDEDDDNRSRVVQDVRTAEINNHRQMNSHPFEFLFLNLAQSNDWNTDDNDDTSESQSIRCRPS